VDNQSKIKVYKPVV